MKAKLQVTELRKCLKKIIDYRGKTPKKLGSDWRESGYRALSAINVKNAGLTNIESIRFVDEATYKAWMKDEVQRGDILLTSEAPAGEAMIWDSDERIVLSQRLFCLRANESFDNRFLKYYLQSATGKREVDRTRSGSTVAGISAEMFDQIKVIHPDLPTQRKISDVLSAIDQKISANNRANEELSKFSRTIFDYWFVQFDFPDHNGNPYKTSGGSFEWNDLLKKNIPSSWTARRLSELVEVSTLTIDPSLQPDKCFKHLSIPSFDHSRSFNEELGDTIRSNKFLVGRNDLLVSKLNPQFNRVFADTNHASMICSTEFVVWRCTSMSRQAYLHSIATGQQFISYCVNSASGTSNSHRRVNPQVMMNFLVPFDPQLADDFGELNKEILSRQVHNMQQNIALTELRDWLLPLLINGQVQVI